MPATILLSTALDLINTAVGVGVNGLGFAGPVPACLITWQVLYGTPPASNTINLQGSNDNVTFFTIDTTTSVVNGNLRITAGSARFYRINMSAVAGGDTFRVIASFSPLGVGRDIYGGNNVIATQAFQVPTTAVITEEVLFAITLNARSFITTGRSLRLRWGFKTAATATAKVGRVRFGADTASLFSGVQNNIDSTGEYIVMRRGLNSFIRRAISMLNGVAPALANTAITQDESLPIVVQITGQNGVANAADITLEWVIVDTIPGIPNII